MWAAQYCDFREPRLWLTSGSMGTMGFGLPAAIGAQIANPGKLVIDVDGDASIRMNLGELETVTTYDLPIKIVVLNNFGDGMVRQWQRLFFKGRFSASDKIAAQEGLRQGRAGRRLRLREAPRREATTCRACSRSSSSFAGPPFLEVIIDPRPASIRWSVPGCVPRDDHGRSHRVPATAEAEAVAASEMF